MCVPRNAFLILFPATGKELASLLVLPYLVVDQMFFGSNALLVHAGLMLPSDAFSKRASGEVCTAMPVVKHASHPSGDAHVPLVGLVVTCTHLKASGAALNKKPTSAYFLRAVGLGTRLMTGDFL